MTETGESVLGARSLSLSLPVSLSLREVLITQTTLAWQRRARLSPNAGLLGRAFVLAARQVPTCHRAVLPAPATSPPPLPGQGRFNAHALLLRIMVITVATRQTNKGHAPRSQGSRSRQRPGQTQRTHTVKVLCRKYLAQMPSIISSSLASAKLQAENKTK